MSENKYLDYEGLQELVNQLKPEDNFSETSKKAVQNQLVTNTFDEIFEKLIELFEEYMERDLPDAWSDGGSKLDMLVLNQELTSASPTAQITFEKEKKNTDYMVHIEAMTQAANDEVGEIYLTDKATTGFKVTYTGSASSINVKMYILGG